MAIHHQIPIYKQGYDLLSLAADVQQNMPRAFKASLGTKIHNECVEILVLIGRANAARGMGRAPHIVALVERVEVVSLLLRLSHDKRFISPKLWAGAVQLTGSIGKQAGSTANMGPITHVAKVGKKAAGRLLDAREWNEVPE